MRTIPVDIDGLNLILGGGIPILKRHVDFEDESATVLIRGPAGAGKTIFGTQLACSLARVLGCDVAYGCIELLPSELEAQHAGTKRADVKERVVQAPFAKQEQKGEECRIFAGMLDVGTLGKGIPPVNEAIGCLIDAIEEVGGKPRVVVIDSLSEGYGLGASAPRSLADDLCKMAAMWGKIFVLLEESSDLRSSIWSFAVDIVLQLSPSEDAPLPGASNSFERRLVVAKNRLGPSESGVHRFSIMPDFGVKILPQPRAYLSKWAPNVIWPSWKNEHLMAQGWPFEVPKTWPRFQVCTTAVYGLERSDVQRVAERLGLSSTEKNSPVPGYDMLLDFGRDRVHSDRLGVSLGDHCDMGCGDPYMSGDWLLSDVLATMDELKLESRLVRRVLAGNLQSLRSFWDPEGIRRALGVLIAILRRVNVPVILFETLTSPVIAFESISQRSVRETAGSIEVPRVVDFADVVIEVRSGLPSQAPELTVSHARSGERLVR